MARVLLVDGDEDARERLRRAFEDASHAVVVAGSLAQALWLFDGGIEALVLALPLPDARPEEALRLLRTHGEVPMLVLGGVPEVSGTPQASLPKGAPAAAVVERLGLLLRLERSSAGEEVLVVGPLEVHVQERRVWRAGEEIGLAPREFDLLLFFLRHPSLVLSREDILRALWPEGIASPHVVEVHLAELRHKLGKDVVRTIRGLGYRLEVDPPPHVPTHA
jgi:DNA-binding response OmpR family regulator